MLSKLHSAESSRIPGLDERVGSSQGERTGVALWFLTSALNCFYILRFNVFVEEKLLCFKS